MLHGYQRFLPLRDIADAIWRGEILMNKYLDGSPTVALKCGGNLPTLADYIDMDSHCPKGAGLYAALCFVRLLLLDHPQSPLTGMIPWLHFVLDNKRIAIDDLEWTFNNDTSVYTYLKADYNILQGIQHEIANLPIASSVEWVKGHQDWHKPRSKLSIEALVNCFADNVCTDTHHRLPRDVWRFPDWVPGTRAALLHKGKLVSKKQDKYVRTAATVLRLHKCLTLKSQCHDPLIPNDWSDDTFDDIDWKSVRLSIKCQPYGWHFQISKFAHNWTPTLHQRATQDNSINWRCFKCGAWKEDIDHVLWCPSDLCDTARTKAKTQFLNHLAKYHTPAPMATIIMSALDRWFSSLPPDLVPCLPTGPTEPNCILHRLINKAFVHQNYIGWGHFYEAASRSSGSHALQSITKSVNQETHSTQIYGCKKQLMQYCRSS